LSGLKPIGAELELFSKEWKESNAEGKFKLVKKYETTYKNASKWASKKKEEVSEKNTLTKPLTLKVTKDQQIIAVIGDTHNPYQDKKVISLVTNFLGELQPDVLIMNGDMNDFYQVSVFSKDIKRMGHMQEDINSTKEFFAEMNKVMPNTKKILIEGTHEYRWNKFLQHSSPATSVLDCLSIPALFELDKYDIEYVEYERGLLINDVFLVIHGDIASKHSGETAKNQYLKNGGNGICNHTHKGGSFFKRDRFGVWGWWENYCLCSLNPDWIQNPNWVQGFSLVNFTSEQRFFVEQIPIIGNKFMYGGKLWK
jgi:hypothetical protein